MSGVGRAMQGGGDADNRIADDFYQTPPDTTRSFAHLLRECGFPDELWECAAGEGHMSLMLQEFGFDVVATDLVDRGFDIGKVDFLKTTKPFAKAICTNPPFNLADKFLAHAVMELGLDHIAFVLPMNFWCAQKRVPVFESNPPALVSSFTWRLDVKNMGRPTMSFMVCIWSPTVPEKYRTRFVPILGVGEPAKPVGILTLLDI